MALQLSLNKSEIKATRYQARPIPFSAVSHHSENATLTGAFGRVARRCARAALSEDLTESTLEKPCKRSVNPPNVSCLVVVRLGGVLLAEETTTSCAATAGGASPQSRPDQPTTATKEAAEFHSPIKLAQLPFLKALSRS